MKKGCLIALVVGLLLVGGFVFLILAATRPVVDSSNAFLAQLGAGKTHEAYASTAKLLRESQSEDRFASVVKQLGLTGYSTASWTSRSIENDTGKVEGTVRTGSGASIPLTINLIKEDGAWRVLSFNGPAAGGSVGGPAVAEPAQVPAADDLGRLVTTSLLSFNEAVTSRSFEAFHATLSSPFRNQLSTAKLQQSFREFVEKKIDISAIKGVAPTFDPAPAIDGDGVLKLTGTYQLEDSRVTFGLKYIREGADWRLLGINVGLK